MPLSTGHMRNTSVITGGRVIDPVTNWYCPNCGLRDQTRGFTPNRFHTCSKLRGLTAPLLREGVKAKVEAHDREDYVGRDIPHTDENGRPVMSITTTRDDGQDVAVLVPTVHRKLK